MVPQESSREHSADVQPRCEFGTAHTGEECQESGDFRYGKLLLCGPHAELLRLEDRAQALLTLVSRMDERIERSGSSQAADDVFLRHVRLEREEAEAALRQMRAKIRSTRKVLE
jgi:hypothetical protein